VDLWVSGTNWYEIKRLRETAFQPSEEDNLVTVHIIWGLREQDRSRCHFTDYKCKGETVFLSRHLMAFVKKGVRAKNWKMCVGQYFWLNHFQRHK
jgi:hypothetical protein